MKKQNLEARAKAIWERNKEKRAAYQKWADALAAADAGAGPDPGPEPDLDLGYVVVAKGITRGSAEAYGWRRFRIAVAVSPDGRELSPSVRDRAWAYGARWARKRGLRFEGLEEAFACPDPMIEFPPRFDAGKEK